MDENPRVSSSRLSAATGVRFMQDGAHSHFSIAVRNYLDNTFPRRWIGRGSELAWPPRSPDCNSSDYYMWGHMKSLVNANTINPREELWDKIQNPANFIRG